MKFNKLLCLGLTTMAIASYSQMAEASYSCSNATYGSSYSGCSANNTANGNATTVTATTVLAASAGQTATIIANRVGSAMGAGSFNVASNGFSASTGRSAGDMPEGAGMWVSGSWTGAEDDNAATESEGDVYTAMVGADFEVTDATLVGLAVGYETLDFDTMYNDFGSNRGSLESDGWTVAPYVAMDLGDMTANLSVGYSSVDYDTVRFDPNTGNRITGSTDAERWFVTAGVGGSHEIADHVRLRTNGSVFYVTEDKDGFTEREAVTGASITQRDDTNELGKASIDWRLGYMLDGVEPYALVGVDYDFVKSNTPLGAGQTESGTQDDFGAKFGAGLSLDMGNAITGGVEAYTSEFRDDYNEYNATANIRVKF